MPPTAGKIRSDDCFRLEHETSSSREIKPVVETITLSGRLDCRTVSMIEARLGFLPTGLGDNALGLNAPLRTTSAVG